MMWFGLMIKRTYFYSGQTESKDKKFFSGVVSKKSILPMHAEVMEDLMSREMEIHGLLRCQINLMTFNRI